MIRKAKNLFRNMGKGLKKVGIAALAIFGCVGLVSNFAHAEADPIIVSSMATGTSMLKDNAFAFIPYILSVFGAVTVLTLIIVGIKWGIKKVRGTIK